MTSSSKPSANYVMPPGQGHGDAVGLVRALLDKGVPPWLVAVEVISDELVSRGVDYAARTSAAAARQVLSGAAWVN